MLRSLQSLAAVILVAPGALLADAGAFLRGDANDSGAVDISDMVHILGYLFVGGRPPGCEDAADVDDDGVLLISDAIFGLNFLFTGGRSPPAPGARTPGFDGTPTDAFHCGDATPLEELVDLKALTGGFETDPAGRVGVATLPAAGKGVLVDLGSGQELGAFETGRNPGIVRFSSNGPQLFVVNQGTPARPEDSLTWVDFSNPRRPLARILRIGARPFDIVPVPRLDRAFALGAGTAEQPAEILAILDSAKGEVLATFDVDFRPRKLDISADGTQAILIGDAARPTGDGLVRGAIARLDLANGGKVSQTATLDEIGLPFDARITPQGIFVSDAAGTGRFSVIRLNSDLKTTGGIGRGWRAELLFTPDGSKGYSLSRPGNDLLIFDARTMREIASVQLADLDTDPVGPPSRPSRRMIMTPDAGLVLIATGHGELVGIDVKSDKPLGRTHLDPNELGFAIESLSLAPDGRRLFVADGAGGLFSLVLTQIQWQPLLQFRWELFPPFILTEIPISGDTCLEGVAILVDDGLGNANTSFVTAANVEQSRNAIGRFYGSFPDIYDMVITFYGSEFGDVTSPGAFAFAVPVRNFTRGLNRTIGRGQFAMADRLEDAGVDRLSNFIWENDLNEYDEDHLCVNRPVNAFGNLRDGLSILGQEVIHRWAAFADVSGKACTILRDAFHYSQFFNADASVIGGNQGFRIADNGGGSFSHTAVENNISNLDEYLMGFRTAAQVTQALFCVSNPSAIVANSFTGNRVNITMDEFIEDNGERFPGAGIAQRVFNVAYVLIVPEGDHVLRADLDEVKSFRDDFTAFFESQTQGRGHLNTRICPGPFTTTSTIPLGVRANDVVVAPNGRWAYVVSVTASQIKVIDTDPASATFHTVIDTIDVSDAPAAVAFRRDSARAFVASINTDRVDIINTATREVIGNIPVGNEPRGIFINNANFGFVTNSADDDVTIFRAVSLDSIGDTSVGDRPSGVAGTLDNEVVIYTNRNDNTVTIHETRTESKFTRPTGDNPIAVALVQSESLPNQTVDLANDSPSPVSIAYVANADSDNVTVIGITTNPDTVDTTGEVLDTIPVGNSPVAVAFQPNGAIAIVVNRGDSNVSLIEVAKHEVYDTVTVGTSPEGVGFAPDGKRAYVANAGSMSVTVLE